LRNTRQAAPEGYKKGKESLRNQGLKARKSARKKKKRVKGDMSSLKKGQTSGEPRDLLQTEKKSLLYRRDSVKREKVVGGHKVEKTWNKNHRRAKN